MEGEGLDVSSYFRLISDTSSCKKTIKNDLLKVLFDFVCNNDEFSELATSFYECCVPSDDFSAQEFINFLAKVTNLPQTFDKDAGSHRNYMLKWLRLAFLCLSQSDKNLVNEFAFLLWTMLAGPHSNQACFLMCCLVMNHYTLPVKVLNTIIGSIHGSLNAGTAALFQYSLKLGIQVPNRNLSRSCLVSNDIPHLFKELRPDINFSSFEQHLLIGNEFPNLQFCFGQSNKHFHLSPFLDFCSVPKTCLAPRLFPVKHAASLLAFPQLWPTVFESPLISHIFSWIEGYLARIFQQEGTLSSKQLQTLRNIRMWFAVCPLGKVNLLTGFTHLKLCHNISVAIIDMSLEYCKHSCHSWSDLYNCVLSRLFIVVSKSGSIGQKLHLAASLEELICHKITLHVNNGIIQSSGKESCTSMDIELISNCIKLAEITLLSCVPSQVGTLVLRQGARMYEKIIALCEKHNLSCCPPLCIPFALNIFFNSDRFLFNWLFKYIYRHSMLRFTTHSFSFFEEESDAQLRLFLDFFKILFMKNDDDGQIFSLDYFSLLEPMLTNFTLFTHPALSKMVSKYKRYHDCPNMKVADSEAFMTFLSDEGLKGLEISYRLISTCNK